MPHPTKTIREWIEAVNAEKASRLTAWELEFMQSITEQFEERGRLSDKQAEILERIYAERTK